MKILIVYASAGAGHKKAAEAIYEAFVSSHPDLAKDVVIIDSLDFTGRVFRWLYGSQYLTLVNYLPLVWGFFYYLFDNRLIYRLLWPIRRIINSVNFIRFESFILRHRPDVVVATHFMATEAISYLKKKGKIECRLFSVVTDYRLHSFWVSNGVDYYCAAVERTKEDLIKWGVEKDKIFITGVPISPKFSLKLDKPQIKQRLEIDNVLFTALIIGGGFGVGPVEELVKILGSISRQMQLLVVCGHNKDLFGKVNNAVIRLDLKAKIYGFVDNVHELMAVSDVLVTKSGGLTTSEALAEILPAVFIKPIPGQETRNSAVLEDYRAAFVAEDINKVGCKVKELFDNQYILTKMKAAIAKIAKPNSAKEIVRLVLSHCKT